MALVIFALIAVHNPLPDDNIVDFRSYLYIIQSRRRGQSGNKPRRQQLATSWRHLYCMKTQEHRMTLIGRHHTPHILIINTRAYFISPLDFSRVPGHSVRLCLGGGLAVHRPRLASAAQALTTETWTAEIQPRTGERGICDAAHLPCML